MKNLGKYVRGVVIISLVAIVSCEETDPEPKLKCLICEDSTDTLCEGDIDPETQQEITLDILKIARDVANAFGATCTLEDK